MFEISGGMNVDVKIDMGAVKGEKGERGEKGETGKGFHILGTYATAEALAAAVTDAEQGDFYNVGAAAPYTIYMWDDAQGWQNQGKLQGPSGAKGDTGATGATCAAGKDGANGATFTPAVSEDGTLSWTNDKSLANPESVNIRGPKGETGAQGGKGDTGAAGPNTVTTETTTNITGLLKGTGSAIAQAVAGTDYPKITATTATLIVDNWNEKTQTVSVAGVTATNHILALAAPASHTVWQEANVYCSAQGAGTLTFTCEDTPTATITANILIVEAAQ